RVLNHHPDTDANLIVMVKFKDSKILLITKYKETLFLLNLVFRFSKH
ncbi:Uncharacterized protein APZ42_009016, partial [Daphnia magna]